MCQGHSAKYHTYSSLSLASYIIQSLFSILSLLRNASFSGIMLLSSVGIRGSPSTFTPPAPPYRAPKEKGLPEPSAAGEFLYGHVLDRLYNLIFFHPNMGILFNCPGSLAFYGQFLLPLSIFLVQIIKVQ